MPETKCEILVYISCQGWHIYKYNKETKAKEQQTDGYLLKEPARWHDVSTALLSWDFFVICLLKGILKI